MPILSQTHQRLVFLTVPAGGLSSFDESDQQLPETPSPNNDMTVELNAAPSCRLWMHEVSPN